MNILKLFKQNFIKGGAVRVIITSLFATLACTGIIYAATTVGTNISTTGTLDVASQAIFSNNVGIGTSSPYAKLSVVGEVVASYFTATSSTATSTIAGGFNAGAGGLVYDYLSGNASMSGSLTVTEGISLTPMSATLLNSYAEGTGDFSSPLTSYDSHWLNYWNGYLIIGAVAGTNSTLVFNITDPLNPEFVKYAPGTGSRACDISGDLLVCTNSVDSIKVYDLSSMNLTTPLYTYVAEGASGRSISTANSEDLTGTHVMKCFGKYCYSCSLDATTPVNERELIRWEIHKDDLGRMVSKVDGAPIVSCHDIDQIGNYIVVTSWGSSVAADNIIHVYESDLSSQVGSLSQADIDAGSTTCDSVSGEGCLIGLNSIAIKGHIGVAVAYGLDNGGGASENGNCITTIDFSNPTSPAYIAHYCDDINLDSPVFATWINNYVIVTNEDMRENHGKVWAFKVSSDGETITKILQRDDNYDIASKHLVVGNYLYLVDMNTTDGISTLRSYGLNGITTPSIQAGSILGDDINITSTMSVGKEANFSTGIKVGGGGIYSSGGASIDNGLIVADDDAVPLTIFGYDITSSAAGFANGSFTLGSKAGSRFRMGWNSANTQLNMDITSDSGVFLLQNNTAATATDALRIDTAASAIAFPQNNFLIKRALNTISTASPNLTAAQWLGGDIWYSGTGGTMTLPSTTDMAAYMGTVCSAGKAGGMTQQTRVMNGGSGPVTLANGATIVGYGTNIIAAGEVGVFITQSETQGCLTFAVYTQSIYDASIDTTTW